MESQEITLILLSDLHFQHNHIREDKSNNYNTILELSKENKIDAIIVPGDLTNTAGTGAYIDFGCYKFYYSSKDDQLTPLKEYIDKLEEIAPTYIGLGNHDFYTYIFGKLYMPIVRYVKQRHGNTRYSWDLKGYHFICLSEYPDKKGREFLREDLKKNTDKDTIIYFHYNIHGPWSDWWSDSDKEKFYNIIKDYKIRAIFVGHWHESYKFKWKNIDIINGAGSTVSLIKIDKENINVSFH